MSLIRSLRSNKGFSLPEVIAASFIMTLVAVLSLQSMISVKSSMSRSSQIFQVEEQHALVLLKSRKYSFLIPLVFDQTDPNVADLARCIQSLKPLAVSDCTVFNNEAYQPAVYEEFTSGGFISSWNGDPDIRDRSPLFYKMALSTAEAQSPLVQYLTPAPPPSLSATVMPSVVNPETLVSNLAVDMENLTSHTPTTNGTSNVNWGTPGAAPGHTLTKPPGIPVGMSCGGPNQPICTIHTKVELQRVCPSPASCSSVNIKVTTEPINGANFQKREAITMIPNEMLLNNVPMTFNCLNAGNTGYGMDNVASTIICVPAAVTLSQCAVSAVQVPRILTYDGTAPGDSAVNCLQVASDCGQLGFSAAGLLSGQASCNTPPAPSGVVSFPQNCVGVWSVCSGSCTTGSFQTTFTQLVPASPDGMSCTGIYGIENGGAVPCECTTTLPAPTTPPTSPTLPPAPTAPPSTLPANCAGGNCCISNCAGINPSCSVDNIGTGAPWNTADSASCFALAHSIANCSCNDVFTPPPTTATPTTAAATTTAPPSTLPPPTSNNVACYGAATTTFLSPAEAAANPVCSGVATAGPCPFPSTYSLSISSPSGYSYCCQCAAGSTPTNCLTNTACGVPPVVQPMVCGTLPDTTACSSNGQVLLSSPAAACCPGSPSGYMAGTMTCNNIAGVWTAQVSCATSGPPQATTQPFF